MTNMDEMSFDQLARSNSKYLTKDDVGEDGMILTVRAFTRENLERDGKEEAKTILHFMEDVKPMVLNSTNTQLLAAATGAKMVGDAKGKTVIVYNDPSISFGGKITGGLRIRKHSNAAPRQAPPRAAAAARAAGEPDDSIPF